MKAAALVSRPPRPGGTGPRLGRCFRPVHVFARQERLGLPGTKVAIVEALNALGYEHTPTFLQGIRHVQMEPVYGGRVDTAAVLRGPVWCGPCKD